MTTVQPVRAADFPAQDNLFQTSFWGTFKDTCGQTPLFFSAYCDDGGTPLLFPFMVLIRPRQDGSCYAYAPKAPSVQVPAEKRGMLLDGLASAVREYLPGNCVCMRYDLAWRSQYDGEEFANAETAGFAMNWGTPHHNLRKAPTDHMCPDTVIINLALTPEHILARMRTTTRNCIRRSYRSGVDFTVCGAERLHDWYKLYRSTAERKHFFHESEGYFERLFSHRHIQENAVHEPPPHEDVIPLSAPAPLPQFHIMTAEKDGVLLSGIIIALSGRNAYYMYAGSGLEQRELMPNYGLQWEAVRFARSKGCTSYDLMGIPPENDSLHPMAGLYIFKTGFGGETVRFGGTWDFPYDEDAYRRLALEDQMGVVMS